MEEIIIKIFEAYMDFGGLVGEVVGFIIAVIGTIASVGVMLMVIMPIVNMTNELINKIVFKEDDERADECPKQNEKTAAKDQNSRKDVAPAKILNSVNTSTCVDYLRLLPTATRETAADA